MAGPPDDTHPDAKRILIEGYRRMSAAEKMRCVAELTAALDQLAMADIRRRHPGASERECRLRLASRWLDPELMRHAFGWDPRQQGF